MKRSQNVHYRRALNQPNIGPRNLTPCSTTSNLRNQEDSMGKSWQVKGTWIKLSILRHRSTDRTTNYLSTYLSCHISIVFCAEEYWDRSQYRRETSLGHSLEIPSPGVISGIEAFILAQYDCRCLLLLLATCSDFSRFFIQNKQEIPAFVKWTSFLPTF
jgi:hypothetical protein